MNYTIPDKEFLALYEGLQKFESQLIGRQVVFLTDNASVTYRETTPHMTPRHARMADYISRFNHKVHHIPGKHNIIPDMLSRQYENEKSGLGDEQPPRDPDMEIEEMSLDSDSGYSPCDSDASENAQMELNELTLRRSTRQSQPNNTAVDKANSVENTSGISDVNDPKQIDMNSHKASRKSKPVPKGKTPKIRGAQSSKKCEQVVADRKAAQVWEIPDDNLIDLDKEHEAEMSAAIAEGYKHDVVFSTSLHDLLVEVSYPSSTHR